MCNCVFCAFVLYYNCPKDRKGLKMKICEFLLDERINDNTTVIIKDSTGRQIKCGRWYEDKILTWGSFHASLEFVAEKNTAIFQLV